MNIVSIILREIFLLFMSYGAMIVYMMNVPSALHYMQLEGYKYSDYMRWLTKNPKLAFKGKVRQLVATGGFYIFITIINLIFKDRLSSEGLLAVITIEFFAMFLLFIIINVVQAFRDKKKRKASKKPLVYTGRAKRLMFWNFITVALLEVTFLADISSSNIFNFYMVKTLVYSIFILLIPINMVIANFLASPTESFIKDRYINSAKRKLRKKEYKNLIRIGITGSYGKTSTKFILQTILSEKYNVLATPESYNTTMGNVKVIREMLKPEHEVLISEMGARYRYDIRGNL